MVTEFLANTSVERHCYKRIAFGCLPAWWSLFRRSSPGPIHRRFQNSIDTHDSGYFVLYLFHISKLRTPNLCYRTLQSVGMPKSATREKKTAKAMKKERQKGENRHA